MPRTKQFDEQEVLKKAMELFWEKGFHATSMQDLVSHLGINRASLYDTYEGKDALFEKAFSLYRKDAQKFLKEVFDSEETIKGGFKKLFDTAIEEALNDPCKKGCFVVNVTTEMVPGNDLVQEALLENKYYVENFFEEQIQKGLVEGEIGSHVNSKSTAEAIFTLYSGLRVVTKVDSNAIKLRKMVEVALSILD